MSKQYVYHFGSHANHIAKHLSGVQFTNTDTRRIEGRPPERLRQYPRRDK